MIIQDIIDQADTLVPNEYETADKVLWLMSINQEFFTVVKCPRTDTFTSVAGLKAYTLTSAIKENTIDRVTAGNLIYRSLNYEDVKPTDNFFTFNETSKLITLSSAPSRSGLSGFVRFHQTSTRVFTVDNVGSAEPDAPEEFQWIYILGLAEYIAKANEEDEKAANYGGQYRAALQVAAQNFRPEAAS